ncbi:MAG: peptidoglycan editing factor PgeF [Ignavibacteria bacterium]|nr:peptidoglycan editing factor PgeF [Ignavibacteria bacterium]
MVIVKSYIFSQFKNLGFSFSTKVGLDRIPPYNFNLSLSVGDSDTTVWENREEFFTGAGPGLQNVAFQKQVHESTIRIVNNSGYQGESDAMITKCTGIGLAVSTADCVPIFLYSPNKHVIAGIHSGWRSTVQEILRKTLSQLSEQFNIHGEDLYAYIGPCIQQNNFETGAEVGSQFPEKYCLKKGSKIHVDLTALNRDVLLNFGIPGKHIQASSLCSYKYGSIFHSYRREGLKSGRAYGIIWLKDQNEN